MKTFEQFLLDEAVSVNTSSFEGAHGKKPGGKGNWIFTAHKGGVDFSKHKEGVDHISHNGSYSEAKSAASKWAKTQGHTQIHVAS